MTHNTIESWSNWSSMKQLLMDKKIPIAPSIPKLHGDESYLMRLVILLVVIASGRAAEVDDVEMVTSFVTMDEKPVSVLMPYICWGYYKLKIFTKSLCDAGIPFAFSFQPNRTEYYLQHNVVVADLACPGTEELLEKADKDELFKSPYRWLIISPGGGLGVLQRLNLLIDSDVVVAQRVDHNFLFIEAYKITEKSEVIFTPRASWRRHISDSLANGNNSNMVLYQRIDNRMSKKYGVLEDYRKSKVLFTRRNNVRRSNLTMVNVITDSNDTVNHLDDRLFLHQDSIAKMSYIVVSICFEMLNATINTIFTNTWGYRDKNGNWQGVVDHLIKKEADLGTMSIFTQDRMKVEDYIAMVGSTAVRFVFREPPLAYMANIFALPFTWSVWLAIFICVLGCALMLFITSKWEASMSMHNLQLDGSWADVLILIIGAVLQQGCTLEPRYAAGRVVMLFLFIAMTILYAAYSANIVVLLRAPSSSVRSLSDLLNSPLKLGASDFEYNRYFIKHLTEPLRKTIYDKKIAPKGKKPNFLSMEEGVEKIRQGLFAFHMELNPGYRLIQETFQEDEKCDLVEIDYINENDPWVPGQKRAAHKDLFKINFIKIRETGIQSCLHRRMYVPKPKCSGAVSTFSSVGITDMYPAMLATLYGFLLAPAVLVLEIAYHRLMKARQRRSRVMRHSNESSSRQSFPR